MASSDWNLTAYLVSLSQTCEMDNKVAKGDNCFVPREEAGNERVFTELKPAFEVASSCDDQQKGTKRLLRCLTAVYGKDRSDSLFTTREDSHDFEKGNTIEQPLISWDLNRLTVVGREAIVGDEYDENGNHSIFESMERDSLRCKNNPHDLVEENAGGQMKEDDENEEEFKFPKCIEDQFREMLLRTRRQNNWHCDKCGSKILHEGENGQEKSLYHQGFYGSSLLSHKIENSCWQDNNIGHSAEETYKRAKTTDEIRKEHENWETKSLNEKGKSFHSQHRAGENEETVNDMKDESIEQLLNFINPEIDVMGKTFHNIPSTQPIYSDNEARDAGSGDEVRVRRPMNAFMLWARKYRSLVAKEFSEASNSEISVKLGEIWNELTSEQQRPYFKKAEWLKAKHKQTHPNYVYQPRQSYKTIRKMRNSSLCTGADVKGSFGMFPIDFGTPYELLAEIKQKATIPAATQEESKEQLLLKQNYKNNSSDALHKIMAPKPVYPRSISTRRTKCGDDAKDELEEQISLTKQEAKNLSCQSQLADGSYLRRDIGLVKDVMMPRPERNADECDLINSQYPSLNVDNLDEFLAEENTELITYLESCMRKKDFGQRSVSMPKKVEKRKRGAKDRAKGPRAKKQRR